MKSFYIRTSTQSGFILFTSLMFLMIVTLLGVTILRMNTMDERMSRNLQENNRCFQAAEATLKFGENRVQFMDNAHSLGGKETGGLGPSKIYHREAPVIGDITSRDVAWWVDHGLEFPTDIKGVDRPYFLIQHLWTIKDNLQVMGAAPSGVQYFRVTARCKDRGDDAGTEVILQSVFTRRI